MKTQDVEQTDWWSPEALPGYERLATGEGQIFKKDDWATWLTLAAGAGLLGYGLIRRDRPGLASAVAGSALIYQGTQMAQGTEVEELLNPKMDVHWFVTIWRPAHELYEFWKPENMHKFMPHVRKVEWVGSNRQRWTISGPMKRKIEWESEIISNIPNRLISWQTLPGSMVEEWGSVEFTPVRGSKETEVAMSMSYRLPGGYVGAGLAAWAGIEPSQAVRESLRRFKQLMETGEIATVDGQPSGRRSMLGKTVQSFLGQRPREPRRAG